MLGWAYHVWRPIDPPGTPAIRRRGCVCTWETGLQGIKWIDSLVEKNLAESHGGDGYPLLYSMNAATFRNQLMENPPCLPPTDGIPGAIAISNNELLEVARVGMINLDKAELDACNNEEILSIEVWDLS